MNSNLHNHCNASCWQIFDHFQVSNLHGSFGIKKLSRFLHEFSRFYIPFCLYYIGLWYPFLLCHWTKIPFNLTRYLNLLNKNPVNINTWRYVLHDLLFCLCYYFLSTLENFIKRINSDNISQTRNCKLSQSVVCLVTQNVMGYDGIHHPESDACLNC